MNKKQIKKNLKSWVDPAYFTEGKLWYKNAHEFCTMIATEFDMSVSMVAGVVSALSVAVKWDVNKQQAYNLIAAFHYTGNINGVILSTYKRQIRKALDILELPVNYDLNDIINILGKRAFKTKAFFWNLFCPQGGGFVVIDRHIFNAAGVKPLSGNRGQYNMIANCIYELSREYDIQSNYLQAAVWLNIKNNDTPF